MLTYLKFFLFHLQDNPEFHCQFSSGIKVLLFLKDAMPSVNCINI